MAPNNKEIPWVPKLKTKRRLQKKLIKEAEKKNGRIHISFKRLLILIFMGLTILIISCYSAFLVGSRTIPYQTGKPLGVVIGGLLILFFGVLYGDPINKVKVVKCDKCGYELHPGSKFCGECGYKKRLER